MDNNYLKVESFQQGVMAWSAPEFVPELALYAEFADLILDAFNAFPQRGTGKVGEQEMVVMILVSRMFNDYEACKRLLLIGLPEQAYMPLRDAIEAGGLVSLFRLDQKKALSWLSNLNEYGAGTINAALEGHGFKWEAYQYYGFFSHLTHPNLLATASMIKETNLGNRSAIRHFHLGGYKNEIWIRREFHILLVMMLLALHQHLAPIIVDYSDRVEEWWQQLRSLIPRLGELGITVDETPADRQDPPKKGRSYKESVDRRLNIKARIFDPDWNASDSG